MKRNAWITILVFSTMIVSCERAATEWPDPVVDLSSVGQCKGTGLKDSGVPSNQDCLKFEYLNDSVLHFVHVNAGFNCCPRKVDVKIDVKGDTLLITETESGGVCDCNCLYDLQFSISNVRPGKYHISVSEPLVSRPDDTPLVFSVDLSQTKSGENCVVREHYPWGL